MRNRKKNHFTPLLNSRGRPSIFGELDDGLSRTDSLNSIHDSVFKINPRIHFASLAAASGSPFLHSFPRETRSKRTNREASRKNNLNLHPTSYRPSPLFPFFPYRQQPSTLIISSPLHFPPSQRRKRKTKKKKDLSSCDSHLACFLVFFFFPFPYLPVWCGGLHARETSMTMTKGTALAAPNAE